MKKYNCFLFDFDGTLADSRVSISNSVNYALKKHNLPTFPNEKIFPLIGKLNIEKTFEYFYPKLSPEIVTQLISDFRAYQIKNITHEVVIFPEVRETLIQLQNRKKTLAIATTKDYEMMNKIAQILHIDTYFDFIFGVNMTQYQKPQKECFTYIMSQLPKQFEKNKYVMIGDTTVDCEFAKNSEIDMIGVSHGIDTSETLTKYGALYILKNFTELLNFA